MTGPDEIDLNYVAPTHRFAGVSKALLAALEDRIRQSGASHARLTSTDTAHRFYLANGWEDAGPAEANGGMLCHPMERRLQGSAWRGSRADAGDFFPLARRGEGWREAPVEG